MAYTNITKGQPDWDTPVNANFQQVQADIAATNANLPTDSGWLDGTKLTIGTNASTTNFVYRIIKIGNMKIMYVWGDFTIQAAIYEGTWGSSSSYLFDLPAGYSFSKATNSVYRYHDQNSISSPLIMRPYGTSHFIVDTTSSTALSSYPNGSSVALMGYIILAD